MAQLCDPCMICSFFLQPRGGVARRVCEAGGMEGIKGWRSGRGAGEQFNCLTPLPPGRLSGAGC